MKARTIAGMLAAAAGVVLGGALALSQSRPPTEGPGADGSPAWFLQGSFVDPGGRTIVEPGGRVTVPARAATAGQGAPAAATPAPAGTAATPPCRQSPVCGKRNGLARQSLQRVQWKQTLGYTFAYPYDLPPGPGGVPAV